MPHKHKRKRTEESDFNLPPSQRACPLPVVPKGQSNQNVKPAATPKSRIKSKQQTLGNDAPRAFRRLMALTAGKKLKSGLDHGKSYKKTEETSVSTKVSEVADKELRILPGEKLGAFAARVDAALPLAGLTKKIVVKDGKDEQGIKVHQTRRERKMHKLYGQWRAEEQKIQEQKEEELERSAERALEKDPASINSSTFARELDEQPEKRKGKRKGRQRGVSPDEDPWLELKRKRGEPKIELHDVVKAPPQLNKKTTRQLKVGGAAVSVGTIPKAAGSLRRREVLEATRADVLEAYRKIREHEQAKITSRTT